MKAAPSTKRGLSRRSIRALTTALVSGAFGKFVEILLGDKVAEWLKELSKYPFYQNRIVPFVVALIPFVIVAVALIYALSREDAEEETDQSKQPADSHPLALPKPTNGGLHPPLFTPEKEALLKLLGIIDVTPDLQDSEFHPKNCMSRTKKHLMFMGILGSKWVSDPVFETFVRRLALSNGSIQFLLIDPHGRSFARLAELRQGNISTSPLSQFSNIQQTYPALRVKLYDDMPIFRLVFIDGHTVAVSRYKLDRDGHFQSKQGWDAPHLVFGSESHWSLYDTFDDYFTSVWNRSTDLQDFLAANQPVKVKPKR